MTSTLEQHVSGGHGRGGHGGHGDHEHGHAKPKHLDDFFESLRHGHDDELEKSFSEYKDFVKEENNNHWRNKVFTPAQDALYNKIVQELEHVGEDEAKTHGKKEGLQKAIANALTEYFEKSHLSVRKATEGMKDEEKYEFLTKMYDDHVGADGENIKGIKGIAEQYAKDKKKTLGHVKWHFKQQQAQHIQSAHLNIVNKKATHLFNKYDPTEVSAYLKPKIEEQGLEIENKVKFATLKLGDYIKLYTALEDGNFGDGGYSAYGLKKKGKPGEAHEEHEERTHAGGNGAHHN